MHVYYILWDMCELYICDNYKVEHQNFQTVVEAMSKISRETLYLLIDKLLLMIASTWNCLIDMMFVILQFEHYGAWSNYLKRHVDDVTEGLYSCTNTCIL